MNRPVIIGTRGSDLALWQANFVRASLQRHFPEVKFETKIISTTGDEVVDVALSKIGDKGLFTHQIEAELLDGGIDLAVHSLKDLQTALPESLIIGAVCEREVPNDAFISRSGAPLAELPQDARVATGSLRRRSQLLDFRPDLNVEEIRGNVPTRLRKFDASELDGIVLAFAGLRRLGFEDRITHLIPTELMLPAVGQGAVAVEINEANLEVAAMVAKLDHTPTRICTTAERAFLRCLEGGCQVPIGGLGRVESGELVLTGFVGSLDGTKAIRESITGAADDPEGLGIRLAERVIELGGRELVGDARRGSEAAAQRVL
jgi:hydroxymethylbilane synthase